MPPSRLPACPAACWRPPILAAAALTVVVAFAAAKALTVQIASAGRVVGPAGAVTREPLAVNGSGRVVYFLSGETRRHPKCTGVCLHIWLPVTVPAGTAPSKASTLSGTLGVWRRGSIRQVTLSGHPLYTFVPDRRARVATGAGIVSFGGTWHVITTRRTVSTAPSATAPTTTTSSTTTPTTTTSTTTSTSATSSNPYGY